MKDFFVKLIRKLVKIPLRVFWLVQELRFKGGVLLATKGSRLKGFLLLEAYAVCMILMPVWFLSFFVMVPVIVIHAGWMGLVAYLICKFTGACPI